MKNFKLILNIALGKKTKIRQNRTTKRIPLKSRILCSILVLTITTIILMLIKNFLLTGMYYTFCSLEKRLAILFASEGDWSHWMTGGNYRLFSSLKASLIESNSFASMISSLATHGIIAKVLQLVILAICNASFYVMLYVIFKCICNIFVCVYALLK
jgi:hypothetical protein